MPAEQVSNPPSVSKRLMRQWRWVAIAIAVIALALLSEGVNLSGVRGAVTDACQVEVTADVLNVRAGPSTESVLVGQLNRGEVVSAQPDTSNGFRKLAENRWVAIEYVTTRGNCG